MKLVFYGGGDEEDNYQLDQFLIKKLTNKRKLKMTFIPSSSYMSHLDFRDFVYQYQAHNVEQFIHFPVDVHFTEVLKKEAFSADIIHLAGGNTYYFLATLRRAKLFNDLKKFINRGGILTGLSAGAIIMTPEIQTAGFPPFDCDENEDNITDLRALNLVNFEFFPHYRNSKRYDQYLLEYSLKSKRKIYASPDGSGVIVDHNTTTFCGRNYIFYQGKKIAVK